MFHPTLSKSGRFFFAPLIKICEFIGIHFPSIMVQMRYYACFKRFANLRHPQNLNEKILYYKLYKDTSRWSDLVDKLKVRSYVEKMGFKENLVKLYGYWYSVDDFKKDFDSLPESFILKANNGEGKGTNLIISNKNDYVGKKYDELCEKVSWWLSRKNIGALVAEPQYRDIKPCIIAEELLPIEEGKSTLTDYKIWCFEGTPYFTWVCNDRSNGGNSAHVLTYDIDWNPHPEYSVFNSDYLQGAPMPKPENYEQMIDMAAALSQGFPELRVDLYNINGKIYFGELTFTSQGGINNFFQQPFLEMCGKLFDVESLPNKR